MKLIVALDFNEPSSALALVEQLDPNACILKVGLELYTRLGPSFVEKLTSRQFKVFLDLKFHDIPNTVAQACKAAADLGVWMINVHALGGYQMMHTAMQALSSYGESRPLLIAVTILTSFTQHELPSIGITQSLVIETNQLAILAERAGLDGVVCSAFEVEAIKATCGASFLTVTPGIRFPHDPKDDQARFVTPQQAIAFGSDFLVVGRSITKAPDPMSRVRDLLKMVS
jgi:orotidine-5'-phosphate decarboxylase